jgi:hypothetical protein
LYTYPDGGIEEKRKQNELEGFDGYVSEEYGLWQGRPITRAEYDDGAAMLDGRPTRTSGAELRVRFLTPYNFVICGQRHVINTVSRDLQMKNLLNQVLRQQLSPQELGDVVSRFPPLRRQDWPDDI